MEKKIHTYTTANAVLGTVHPTNTTAASTYGAWLKKTIKTNGQGRRDHFIKENEFCVKCDQVETKNIKHELCPAYLHNHNKLKVS